VHVQELSLLLLDFFKHGLAALDLLLGGCDLLAEILDDRVADLLAFSLAERHASVVLLDLGFYEVDGLVALRALPALALGANEVLVDTAVAIVAGVDELAVAGAAADGALEVVLVLAVALPGVPVRDEHGLDLVEQLLADERLVPALIDVAVVLDEPAVVGVAQKPVDLGEAERVRTTPAGRAGKQATRLKQARDVRQAVKAGGVGLERPHDDLRALRVDDHGADLAAVRQGFPNVQVADRRWAAGAADLDLAFDAALDLLGDLDPPRSRRRCHDALKQDAVRGVLADWLLDGDELGAGFRDHATGDPVVLLVSRPARDAPDDHEIDVALLGDLVDHPTKRRALEQRAARDPRLDVLADHDRAVPLGIALARLALRGDRQALRVVVGIDLPG
jgi:hypothetical protein